MIAMRQAAVSAGSSEAVLRHDVLSAAPWTGVDDLRLAQ
jgi:hypothetical protein